ncbi:MAG: hypothetical protein MJ183_03635 [Treponemataceae bacterium]|nr:hypothetical protein [Treponemataceae bacterium]
MSLEQENKNNDLNNMQSEELEKYGVWVKRPVPDSLSINPFDNTFTVETASTLFTEEDPLIQSVSADLPAEEEISLSDFLGDSSEETTETQNTIIEETEQKQPENLEFNDIDDSVLSESTDSLGAAGIADFDADALTAEPENTEEKTSSDEEPEIFGDMEFENLSESNELTPLSSYDFSESEETASTSTEEDIPDPVFQDTFPESLDELSFTDSLSQEEDPLLFDNFNEKETNFSLESKEPVTMAEDMPVFDQLPEIEETIFETPVSEENQPSAETIESTENESEPATPELPKDPFDNSIFEETGLVAPADSEENISEEIDFNATEEVSLDDFLDGMDFEEPDMPVAASTIAAVTAAVESGKEEEISLDEFGVDFDSGSGDGTESVSLDEFGIDFSDSSTESVSLEDFIPTKKKEKNDIINDPPLDIELSFDDNFVMETVANPEDNIEGENDFMDAVFTGDSFDNFDDIFENITDIGETSTPAEEPAAASSEISFDDVSEFDDLLNSFSDEAPVAKAETGAVSVSGPAKQRDYDLFVSMEDEEKPAAQSATVHEEEEEEAVVELYTDSDDSEGFNISAPIEGASSSFSLSDMADFDDSIEFIDETNPFDQAQDQVAVQETDPAQDQSLPEEIVTENIAESEEVPSDPEQETIITKDENVMQDLSLPEDLDLPDDIDLNEAFNLIDSTDFSALTEEFAEEPATAEEEPVQTEEPVVAEDEPIVTEEPVVAEDQPIVTEEPAFDEVPAFAAEEPVVTEEPVADEVPAFAAEEPVVTEEPVVDAEEPVVTEEPVVEEEPAFDAASPTPVNENEETAMPKEEPCAFQYETDNEYPIFQDEEEPMEEPIPEPEVSDAEESFLSTQPEFDQNEMNAFVGTVDSAENDKNDLSQFAADTITDSDIPTVSSLLSDFDNKLDNSSISEYTDSVDFTEDFTSMNEEPIISDSNTSTADVLNQIMNELSALRSEINTLRTDIDALKANKSEEPEQFIPQEVSEDIPATEDPVIEPAAEEPAETSGGFFADDGEDDTIALSGDELNNILNSADFTEENAEDQVVEDQPAEETPAETDLDSEAEIEPMAQIEEDMSVEMPEIEEPIIEEPAFEENDYGLDDPEAEVPTELPDEIDIPQMENTFDEPAEEPVVSDESIIIEETDEPVAEEPAFEEPVIDEPEPEVEETVSEEIAADEPVMEDNSAFADIMADIQDSAEEETSDVSISEDELARALQSTPVTEEAPVEEPVFEEPVAEETPAEPEAFTEEPACEEPVFEEVSEEVEDDIDETPTDKMFESEDWNEPKISEEEILGDASFEDNGISLDEDFEVPAGETDDFASEVSEEDAVDEPVAEELNSFEEPAVPEIEETVPETAEPAPEEVPEEPAASLAAEDSSAVPDELKQDVKSVLLYMDQLLENLPEEKIAEFARSEHFEVYRKLFTELGLA